MSDLRFLHQSEQTTFEHASRVDPELEKMAAAPAGEELEVISTVRRATTTGALVDRCRAGITHDPMKAVLVAVVAGFVCAELAMR